jgi:hypothetical protein
VSTPSAEKTHRASASEGTSPGTDHRVLLEIRS